MYSYGPPHMAGQKQDDQCEHTYSRYVRIRDVALKTYRRRWTIGRSGERRSGISMLAAQHNDDDDDIYMRVIQKVLSLTQVLVLLHSFQLCVALTCTEIQKEIWSSFSSFIKSVSALPQWKCSAMALSRWS